MAVAVASRRAETLAGDWGAGSFCPPRIHSVPTQGARDREFEARCLDLVYSSGLYLDPWEEAYLIESLRVRPDGLWSAVECGLCAPRQNGKGSCLEARELIAMFIDAEAYPLAAARLVVHSAHDAKTAHEGFERLFALISGTPRLRVKMRAKSAVRAAEGGEAIILADGRRIRFRTRTNAGARGLSGDLVVFDEAMIVADAVLNSVWPIITARPNPQVWFTGSAVDASQPLMAEYGLVFSRLRNRGIAADPDLLYAEWSLDYEHPDLVPRAVAMDPESWALTNPGLDARLSRRIIAVEQRQLTPRGFAVERLGVGNWPDPEETGRALDPEKWRRCGEDPAKIRDPVCAAFDVTPDRSFACVAVAGYREDGKAQVEIVRHARRSDWVPEVLAALRDRSRPAKIVCDASGQAGSLLPATDEHHLRVEPVTTVEHSRGCGAFYDGVDLETLRHLGDPSLDSAVLGAVPRKRGDAWLWDKRKSEVDISPLVAATLALWALLERRRDGGSLVFSAAELMADDDEDEGVSEDELPPLGEEDL